MEDDVVREVDIPSLALFYLLLSQSASILLTTCSYIITRPITTSTSTHIISNNNLLTDPLLKVGALIGRFECLRAPVSPPDHLLG